MSRRRMIDPGIWGSEDFNHLSLTERLLWIGLFSNADDYGKGRAAPAFLRSTIFPYDDIGLPAIEKALKKLASTMKIELYSIGEARYYRLIAWKKWQQVSHPAESTIPDPVPEQDQETSRNDSGSVPAKGLPNEFKEFKQSKEAPESFPVPAGVRPSAMRPDPISDEARKREIADTLAAISARSQRPGVTT
jgi:hypothetical protein